MDKVYQINGSDLTEIADAIRDVSGSEELMTPDEMVETLNSIEGVSGPVDWDDIKNKPFGESFVDIDLKVKEKFEQVTADVYYVTSAVAPNYNKTYTIVVNGDVYENMMPQEGKWSSDKTWAWGATGVTPEDCPEWDTTLPFSMMTLNPDDDTKYDTEGDYLGTSFVFFANPNVYPNLNIDNGVQVYETELTVHTLDEKYIPDTISRTDHTHSWLALEDKPFGPDIEPEVIEENITCTFTTAVGTNVYLGIPSLPDTLPLEIKSGEIDLQIIWNGIPYVCKPVIVETETGTSVYYGDVSMFNVVSEDNDTSVPFCLYWNSADAAAKMYAKESGTHTFTLNNAVHVIRTIDKKYLPDDIGAGVASWNDLQDRPFGEEIEKVILVETFTDEYGEETPNRNRFELTLEEGKSYIVNWDEVEYECVCFVDTWDRLVIGNAFLMETGDDTNEPFLIGIQEGDSFVKARVGGEHTLSISSITETIKTLDEKYLPTAEDEDILNLLIESDAISVVADKNETILVDKDGNIILW